MRMHTRKTRKNTLPRLTRLLALPLCGLGLASLVGCQHSDAPIQPRGEQYETEWLMMGSEDLRRSTLVQSPRQFYDQNNLLHVTVPVRNTTDKQLYVEYRYYFYDRNGRQLSMLPGRVTIPARSMVEVTGNATSPEAEGPMPFRLELRYPRVN
jgi:uncharacterized protein YcfL